MAKHELEKSEIVELYNSASPESKKKLEDKFGKDFFSSGWMELWNKFCKENNINIELPYPSPKDEDEESDNAFKMLKKIISVKNRGWKPAKGEKRWVPIFEETSSGFAFSYSGCGLWRTCTLVGSRLSYKEEKVCNNTVKEYLPIYNKYL